MNANDKNMPINSVTKCCRCDWIVDRFLLRTRQVFTLFKHDCAFYFMKTPLLCRVGMNRTGLETITPTLIPSVHKKPYTMACEQSQESLANRTSLNKPGSSCKAIRMTSSTSMSNNPLPTHICEGARRCKVYS